LVGRRFLEGGEVLSVEVLDECLLHRCEFVDLADHHRHHRQLGLLRSSETTFAGDQFVATL